jgi:hypothetical protein
LNKVVEDQQRGHAAEEYRREEELQEYKQVRSLLMRVCGDCVLQSAYSHLAILLIFHNAWFSLVRAKWIEFCTRFA